MANRQQFTLQFNADVRQAKREFESLSKILTDISTMHLKTPVEDSTIKRAAAAAQELQRHLQSAVNVNTGKLNLNAFSHSLNEANTSVSQLSAALLEAGELGQRAFMQLSSAIAQTEVPLKKTNSLIRDWGTTLKNTVKWELSSTAIHGIESALAGAVSYAKGLNGSLNDIRIVTGASVDEMARFADQANRAAKNLSTTTKAYTDASLIYYQQGDSQDEAARKAELTIKAANASFGTSAQEMSEYLTAVWNSYQVGADELERYVNIMAALGAKTATSLEEIATSMQKVAATSNAVGISMEQVSSIISTVSSVTRESAESIGTSYKTIFARIGDLKLGGTDEDGIGLGQVSSALESIGVEILDTSGNLRDMGDIITDLGNRWQTMNEKQKTAVAQVVAGKRQYTQLMALFENWDMYLENMNIANDSDGALTSMAQTYSESWDAAANRVTAAMEKIYKSLLNDEAAISVLNVTEKIVETLGGVIEGFGGLPGILLNVGGLMTKMFSADIAQGIAATIERVKDLYTNTNSEQERYLNKSREIRQELEASKENTLLTESSRQQLDVQIKTMEAKEQLLKNEKLLTTEQKVAVEGLINAYQQEAMAIAQITKELERQKEAQNRQKENLRSNLISDEVRRNAAREGENTEAWNRQQWRDAKTKAQRSMLQDAAVLEIPELKGSPQIITVLDDLIKKTTIFEDKIKTVDQLTFDDLYNTTFKLTESLGSAEAILQQMIAVGGHMGEQFLEADKSVEDLSADLMNYIQSYERLSNDTDTFAGLREKLSGDISQIGNEEFKDMFASIQQQFQLFITNLNPDIEKLQLILLNMVPDEQMRQDLQRLFNDWKATGRQMEEASERNAKSIEMAYEKMSEEIEKKFKNMSTKIQKWVNAAGDLESIFGALTSFKSTWETFTNPDASGLEKLGAVISSITAVTMGLQGAVSLAGTVRLWYNKILEDTTKKLAANNRELSESIIKENLNTKEMQEAIWSHLTKKLGSGGWKDALVGGMKKMVPTVLKNAIPQAMKAIAPVLGTYLVPLAIIAGSAAISHHIYQSSAREVQELEAKAGKSLKETETVVTELNSAMSRLDDVIHDNTLTYNEKLDAMQAVIGAYDLEITAIDLLARGYENLAEKMGLIANNTAQEVEAQAAEITETATEMRQALSMDRLNKEFGNFQIGTQYFANAADYRAYADAHPNDGYKDLTDAQFWKMIFPDQNFTSDEAFATSDLAKQYAYDGLIDNDEFVESVFLSKNIDQLANMGFVLSEKGLQVAGGKTPDYASLYELLSNFSSESDSDDETWITNTMSILADYGYGLEAGANHLVRSADLWAKIANDPLFQNYLWNSSTNKDMPIAELVESMRTMSVNEGVTGGLTEALSLLIDKEKIRESAQLLSDIQALDASIENPLDTLSLAEMLSEALGEALTSITVAHLTSYDFDESGNLKDESRDYLSQLHTYRSSENAMSLLTSKENAELFTKESFNEQDLVALRQIWDENQFLQEEYDTIEEFALQNVEARKAWLDNLVNFYQSQLLNTEEALEAIQKIRTNAELDYTIYVKEFDIELAEDVRSAISNAGLTMPEDNDVDGWRNLSSTINDELQSLSESLAAYNDADDETKARMRDEGFNVDQATAQQARLQKAHEALNQALSELYVKEERWLNLLQEELDLRDRANNTEIIRASMDREAALKQAQLYTSAWENGPSTAEDWAQMTDEDIVQYNQGIDNWREYSFAKAMDFYSKLEQLYADDQVSLAVITAQKKALWGEYYTYIADQAQTTFSQDQENLQEQINQTKTALDAMKASLMSDTLDGQSLKLLGDEWLSLDSDERLSQYLTKLHELYELEVQLNNLRKGAEKRSSVALLLGADPNELLQNINKLTNLGTKQIALAAYDEWMESGITDIREFYNIYERLAEETNSEIENDNNELWDNYGEDAANAIEEVLQLERTAAQQTAEAWKAAFDNINKWRLGLAEGQSIAEMTLGDPAAFYQAYVASQMDADSFIKASRQNGSPELINQYATPDIDEIVAATLSSYGLNYLTGDSYSRALMDFAYEKTGDYADASDENIISAFQQMIMDALKSSGISEAYFAQTGQELTTEDLDDRGMWAILTGYLDNFTAIIRENYQYQEASHYTNAAIAERETSLDEYNTALDVISKILSSPISNVELTSEEQATRDELLRQYGDLATAEKEIATAADIAVTEIEVLKLALQDGWNLGEDGLTKEGEQTVSEQDILSADAMQPYVAEARTNDITEGMVSTDPQVIIDIVRTWEDSFSALQDIEQKFVDQEEILAQDWMGVIETLDMNNAAIADSFTRFQDAISSGDTSEVQDALNDLTTAILEQGDASVVASKELDTLLEMLAETYGITDASGKAFTSASLKALRFGNSAKNITKILQTLGKSSGNIAKDIEELGYEAARAGKKFDDYVDSLEDISDEEKAALKDTRNMIDEFEALEEMTGISFGEEFYNEVLKMTDAGSTLEAILPNIYDILNAKFGGQDTDWYTWFANIFNQMGSGLEGNAIQFSEKAKAMLEAAGLDVEATMNYIQQLLTEAGGNWMEVDWGELVNTLGVDMSFVIELLRDVLAAYIEANNIEGIDLDGLINQIQSAIGAAQNVQSKHGGGGGGGAKQAPAQNSLPSATPSGGGGGSGSSPKEETPKEKKVEEYLEAEDEIERYHYITNQLNRTQEALEQIDALKDRAWGKDHIDQIDAEIKKLKENIEEQQKYRDEIASYLAQDRQAVVSLGAQLDEEGNISNYEEIMNKIIAQYNAAVDAYNASAQEKGDDLALEDAKERYDKAKEAIEQYVETLELQGEAYAELLDLQNQISEAALEKVQYKLELVVDLNEADIELLEYYQDLFEDDLTKSDDLLRNMTSQAKQQGESLATLLDAYRELQTLYETGNLNEADFVEGMEELRDQALDYASALQELKTEIVEVYADALDLANEEVENHIDKISHASEVMSNYIEIMGLLGQGTNYNDLAKFYNAQYNMNLQMIASQKDWLDQLLAEEEYYKNQITLTELEQEQYEALQDSIIEAREALLSSTQNALQGVEEAFTNTIQGIFKELDSALAGAAGSLSNLADYYSYYQEADSRYITTAKELYEVSKLNRNIEDSIQDVSSEAAKQRLKTLQEEIKLLSEKNDLTEYDIELLNLQYELAKAQNALEEAQDAKAMVRLTRDSDGNMAYQYTADQSKIDAAQQQYEDVLQRINELTANRASEMEQLFLTTEQQYLQMAQEILTDTTLTSEEKAKRLEEIFARYTETMAYIQEQYTNATGSLLQNQGAIVENYGQNLVNTAGKTQTQLNSILGEMIHNMDEQIKLFDEYVNIQGLGSLKDYEDKIAQIMKDSGLNSDSMTDSIKDFADLSAAAGDAIEDVMDKFSGTLDNLHSATNEWDAHLAVLENVQSAYENIATSAQDAIRTLSGFNTSNTVGSLFGNSMSNEEWLKQQAIAYEQFNQQTSNDAMTDINSLAFYDSLQSLLNTDLQNLLSFNLSSGSVGGGFTTSNPIEQHIDINADFPGVADANEIKSAFNDLINLATQYAYSTDKD